MNEGARKKKFTDAKELEDGCDGCPSAASCAKAQAGIPCDSETTEESEVVEA